MIKLPLILAKAKHEDTIQLVSLNAKIFTKQDYYSFNVSGISFPSIIREWIIPSFLFPELMAFT